MRNHLINHHRNVYIQNKLKRSQNKDKPLQVKQVLMIVLLQHTLHNGFIWGTSYLCVAVGTKNLDGFDTYIIMLKNVMKCNGINMINLEWVLTYDTCSNIYIHIKGIHLILVYIRNVRFPVQTRDESMHYRCVNCNKWNIANGRFQGYTVYKINFILRYETRFRCSITYVFLIETQLYPLLLHIRINLLRFHPFQTSPFLPTPLLPIQLDSLLYPPITCSFFI